MAAQLTSPLPSPAFPIVFFDGDREIDVGPLPVHPSLGFKFFLTAVSQRIGVSPHQISISLIRRKKARASRDVRRKVPIDETTDLDALSRERDCFLLAVLRRSRGERRGRARRKGREQADGEDGDEEEGGGAAPEVTILRRRSGIDLPDAGLRAAEEAAEGVAMWDCERQMRILLCHRERCPISTISVAAPVCRSVPKPAACGECEAANAEGRSPGFHRCVHDAVTFGFRSPVGPIQRPSKERVGSSHLRCK